MSIYHAALEVIINGLIRDVLPITKKTKITIKSGSTELCSTYDFMHLCGAIVAIENKHTELDFPLLVDWS